MIVVRIFGERPLIEELVHDNETHPIGEVQKIALRVVTITDGIDAKLSKLSKSAFPNSERNGCAECTAVMMKTHSLNLEISAVHPEAGGRIEMKFTNTEWNCLLVERFAAVLDTRDRLVKNAFPDVPKLRLLDSEIEIKSHHLVRSDVSNAGLSRCNGLSIRPDEIDLHTCGSAGGGLIEYFTRDVDRGLLRVYSRGCYKDSPIRKARLTGGHKVHVSIDPGTSVLPRCRLSRIVSTNRDHIVLTQIQMAGHLIREANVPVRPFAEMNAVDPNIAVSHHAVEFDKDTFVLLVARDVEVFAIPTDAGW